jgi:hypothetical protein
VNMLDCRHLIQKPAANLQASSVGYFCIHIYDIFYWLCSTSSDISRASGASPSTSIASPSSTISSILLPWVRFCFWRVGTPLMVLPASVTAAAALSITIILYRATAFFFPTTFKAIEAHLESCTTRSFSAI